MPTPFADIAWPSGGRTWLANARVPACFLADAETAAPTDAEGIVRADLLIDEGRARKGLSISAGAKCGRP
jgi:hypothetical protein